MTHMKIVDLEDLGDVTKEELWAVALKYKDRWMAIKKSPKDRDRFRIMSELSAEASMLAASCVKGANTCIDQGALEDGEIDRRMRNLKELHDELVACRGETLWSKEEGSDDA